VIDEERMQEIREAVARLQKLVAGPVDCGHHWIDIQVNQIKRWACKKCGVLKPDCEHIWVYARHASEKNYCSKCGVKV
jgi:predicted nucleic-acid-binding Zn-ribbon protein